MLDTVPKLREYCEIMLDLIQTLEAVEGDEWMNSGSSGHRTPHPCYQLLDEIESLQRVIDICLLDSK